MVKIRLKRMGAKKRPVYRIVVADSRSPRDGRFIESIGFYDPVPDPPNIAVDAVRVQDWLRKGARPSDSARHILEREGILARASRPRPAGADNGAPPARGEAVDASRPEVGDEAAGAGTAAPAGGTPEAGEVVAGGE